MKRLFGAVFGVALAGTLGAACSGQTSGAAGGGGGPIAEEQFVPTLVDALCDGLAGCCQQAGFPHDPARCRSGFAALYGSLMPSGAGVTYDPEAAGRCVTAFRAAAAGCRFDDDDDPAEAACESVYAGSTPLGGPCESSLDCARPAGGAPVDCAMEYDQATGEFNGTCALDKTDTVDPGGACESSDDCRTPAGAERADCDYSGSSELGTCVALTRGEAGDPCSMTCTEQGSSGWSCTGGGPGDALCYTDDGLWCGAGGVCEALLAIGETCSYEGCAVGAFCDAGTCAAQRAPGETCQNDDECLDGFCSEGDLCTVFRKPGEACVDWDECGPDAHCLNDVCESDGGSGFVSADTCVGEFPFGP